MSWRQQVDWRVSSDSFWICGVEIVLHSDRPFEKDVDAVRVLGEVSLTILELFQLSDKLVRHFSQSIFVDVLGLFRKLEHLSVLRLASISVLHFVLELLVSEPYFVGRNVKAEGVV